MSLLLAHLDRPNAATQGLLVVLGPDDVHNLVPNNSLLAMQEPPVKHLDLLLEHKQF